MSETHKEREQTIQKPCDSDCPFEEKVNAVYQAIFVSNGEPSIKERLRHGNDKMDALAVQVGLLVAEKKKSEDDRRKMIRSVITSIISTLAVSAVVFVAGMVWASKADTTKTTTVTTSSHP